MTLTIGTVALFAFGCYHDSVPLMLTSLLVLVLCATWDDD